MIGNVKRVLSKYPEIRYSKIKHSILLLSYHKFFRYLYKIQYYDNIRNDY